MDHITSPYDFSMLMEVRDYECDLEGIVNNANYLHYLEHTRHKYILEHGISFAQLHEEGVDLVVARITVSYKVPLRSGDEFISCLRMKKEGLRYVFMQDIYRKSDQKLCVRAQVDTVSIVNGKLSDYPPLMEMFR